MVDGGELAHDRLRRLIFERRRQLTLSVSAAAKAAGIHRNTWAALERGERETEDYIFGGVERALRWKTGSVDAILAGGNPAQNDEKPSPANPDWAKMLAEVQAIANNPDRSPGLRAWAQRQVDDIKAILAAAKAEEEAQRRGQAS